MLSQRSTPEVILPPRSRLYSSRKDYGDSFAQRLFRLEDAADNILAAAVVRMRFASVDDLKMSGVLRDLAQAVQVREDQIRALVSRGTPRKTDREDFFIETEARFFANGFQKFVLGDEMCRPDFFRRKPKRAAKTVIVLAPLGDLAIEELLKWRRGPRPGVNAVGDGFDRNFREHLARSDAVLLGHTIDVLAETQRQVGHVQMSAACRSFLQIRIVLLGLQRALHKLRNGSVLKIEKFALLREDARQVFDRKAVVASGNGRVRGENALGTDFFYVFAIDGRSPSIYSFLAEQFQRE